eukprot:5194862-Amphidinium_carterae.1
MTARSPNHGKSSPQMAMLAQRLEDRLSCGWKPKVYQTSGSPRNTAAGRMRKTLGRKRRGSLAIRLAWHLRSPRKEADRLE